MKITKAKPRYLLAVNTSQKGEVFEFQSNQMREECIAEFEKLKAEGVEINYAIADDMQPVKILD